MKVGVLTLMAVLLLALPALAGNTNPCDPDPSDTDGDGICAAIDNCSSIANADQYDGDQDGYGDACDCDFSSASNNFCDSSDFNAFALVFNTGVPPTNCEFDIARPLNSFVDSTDFNAFALVFNTAPGPACGNALGTPCPNGGGTPVPGVPCP